MINQYASTPRTGYGGRSFYLAWELSKRGHKVYLVMAGFHHLLVNPPKLHRRVSSEVINGVVVIWINLPKYNHAHSAKRVINWLAFGIQIARLRRYLPSRVDVVLYSSPSLVGFLGAERLAKRLDAFLAFEVRDLWPLTLVEVGGYSRNHPFIRLLSHIERRAYRHSDVVISNLAFAAEHMEQYGLEPERFRWIPNGVAWDELERRKSLPESVSKQMPENCFVVGYCGTLGVANAVDQLIEAAALLKDRNDIAFVLIGKGKEKELLQKRVRELGLCNVIFIEAIAKDLVQSALVRFDACFIGLQRAPLFRYGVSPNKLYEYMAAGRPIIYAIDSGRYDPVVDARAGIRVDPEDPVAICHAIKRIAAMTAGEREEMGANGKEYVRRRHKYSLLADDLVDALEVRTGQ